MTGATMKHVIVIDDLPDVRESLALVLRQLGCRTSEAADGDEALAIHRRDPADIVITDIVMPGKEGVETIQTFRADFPDVRIIAMSGHDLASTWLRLAEKLGVGAILNKPFSVEALAGAVGLDYARTGGS
jgi:CheY-like chemotaxis protein